MGGKTTMRKWKIEELIHFFYKPVEIFIEELGWYLISDSGEKRLWWKDGYLLFYIMGNDSIYDQKRRIITNYIGIGHISYVKIDYHRFMVVNLEDYSVKLSDNVKMVSTEIITFPILRINNQIVDRIIEEIKEEKRDAIEGK